MNNEQQQIKTVTDKTICASVDAEEITEDKTENPENQDEDTSTNPNENIKKQLKDTHVNPEELVDDESYDKGKYNTHASPTKFGIYMDIIDKDDNNIRRTIYEAKSVIFFKKSRIFTDEFLDLYKINPNL